MALVVGLFICGFAQIGLGYAGVTMHNLFINFIESPLILVLFGCFILGIAAGGALRLLLGRKDKGDNTQDSEPWKIISA